MRGVGDALIKDWVRIWMGEVIEMKKDDRQGPILISFSFGFPEMGRISCW